MAAPYKTVDQLFDVIKRYIARKNIPNLLLDLKKTLIDSKNQSYNQTIERLIKKFEDANPKEPFEHCCGLSGFGRSIHDVCSACHFNTLLYEGESKERAEILTKIAKEESCAALFPHLRKFCLEQVEKLKGSLKSV